MCIGSNQKTNFRNFDSIVITIKSFGHPKVMEKLDHLFIPERLQSAIIATNAFTA